MELIRSLVLALVVLGAVPAWAATYTVSYLGTDCTPASLPSGCGSASQPFRNPHYALGISSPGSFRPAYGDTIQIVPHPSADPDAYHYAVAPSSSTDVVLTPNPSGAASSWLTIESTVPGTMVYVSCLPFTVVANQINSSGCIGSNNAEMIAWNWVGVSPGRQLAAKFTSVTSGRLYNSILDLGARGSGPVGNGNYWGIWCQDSTNVDVRNVKVINVLDESGNRTAQAAGIGQFNCQSFSVNGYEIYNAGTGVDDKEGGQNNTYTLGFIHGIGVNAILINDLGLACCNILNLTFSQTLVVGASACVRVTLGSTPRTYNGFIFKNLTCYNVINGVQANFDVGWTGAQFFNNIIVTNSGSNNAWQYWSFSGGAGTPADYLSDYNIHRNLSGASARFLIPGSTNMATWEAGCATTCTSSTTSSGFLDNNPSDNLQDPSFQGASLTESDPAINWRLGVGNALRTAGSSTGLTSGTAMAIGAFINDNAIPGYIPLAAASTAPAGGPRLFHTR